MRKAEELKILDKITELIASAGKDSYIGMTFAGVPEICRQNIENDFGNCPVEDLDAMRKRFNNEVRMHDQCKQMLSDAQNIAVKAVDERDALKARVTELEREVEQTKEYRASAEKTMDDMQEEITEWKNKFSDAQILADEANRHLCEVARNLSIAEDDIKAKDIEILRLKAEIYDLRKERE